VKKRRIIITEVEDDYGMAHLTLEQEGSLSVADLNRMLANAQFGVAKQLERQLSDVARVAIAGAGVGPPAPLDQTYHLQSHGSSFDPLPAPVRRRLKRLGGPG